MVCDLSLNLGLSLDCVELCGLDGDLREGIRGFLCIIFEGLKVCGPAEVGGRCGIPLLGGFPTLLMYVRCWLQS